MQFGRSKLSEAPMAEAAFATRSWTAGRYTCTLTAPRPHPGKQMHAVVEWSPEQPKHLTDEEIAAYREGRNKALADISRELGIKAAVLEL